MKLNVIILQIGNIQARNPKKSSVIETPFTSVKNLKNRWEVRFEIRDKIINMIFI